MTSSALLLLSVALLAGVPLVIASIRSQFQSVLLYGHISAMLVLGGIFGPIYTLQIAGAQILAGQMFYGSFILTTLLTTILGRDLGVIRRIVVMVIVVDLLAVLVLALGHAALTTPGVANPLGVPAELFDASRVQQLSGAALSVAELLALLAVLEWCKSRLGTSAMIPVYPLAYVAILAFDGLLFPLLVLRPDTGLVDIMVAGVEAKLILAALYAVPLLVFVVSQRRTLQLYETRQLDLRHLLFLDRDPLLAQLDAQRSQLVSTTQDAVRANAISSRLLDAATNTVLISTDPHLMITQFNTGAERILGRAANDMLHRPLQDLVTDDEVARLAEAMRQPRSLPVLVAVQADSARSRDWEFAMPDGDTLAISLNITGILSGDEVVGYLLVGEDVTHRLRAEEAIRAALDNEHASRVRLQEADRVKQQLVSTVSHELRTPIASVRGNLELLSAGDFGDLTPEQSNAISRALRNTSRLERMVRDLLTLERAEGGQLVGERRPLDLRDVVEDCVDLLREQATDHVLRLELPESPVRTTGDADALQRVVVNLVDNAVKFTPRQGGIVVRLCEQGSTARLEVADTGMGIDADDQDKIFGRFFRTSAAVSMQAQGTGLGLSIVNAIVAEHGGRIAVASAVGSGTTITVDLPA